MKRFIAFFLSALMLFGLSACGSDSSDSEDSSNSGISSGENTNNVSESESPGETGKALIVYFSATENTERVAGYISELVGGDIFELIPTTPYSRDDLDYQDNESRVSREHNDESLRNVELENAVPGNWDSYSTVFVGYPIWWGIAAWPVNTFIESNDFTGKTVIPFCTSMSSGVGESADLLRELAGEGEWLPGKRFSSEAQEADVKDWIEGLEY